MFKIIGNLADLKEAIESRDPLTRVDVWFENTGRTLVARGAEGENIDFSFQIFNSVEEAEEFAVEAAKEGEVL